MEKSCIRTACRSAFWTTIRSGLLLGLAVAFVHAESDSKLTGRVIDPSGRVVPGAEIVVCDWETLVERSVTTNREGLYEIPALPVGTYRMQVSARGFRTSIVEELTTEVAGIHVQDVRLEVGDISQEVTVKSQAVLIDGATTSVGHVIDGRTVQEIPLNGRYFLDLAVMAPGSVTSSQNGFNSAPTRGLGAFSINTAGNRDDTVTYLINGITLNDQLFNSILFQPSISTVQEFRMDNSTPSAEYGHSSGAVANVATRSGTSQFHSELFEFLRNDALDARSFFTLTSSPLPFKRNQFGGNLGGPIVKSETFFFLSYEGVRQAQQFDLNSLVFSDADRNAIADGVIAKLAALVPRPNFIDSTGTPRFIGSAEAPVHGDQWALDISHTINKNDRLHGYYNIYRTEARDPSIRGSTVPGFGATARALRQFFSLNEIHTFGHHINEVRLGLNRLSGSTEPNGKFNPVDFGIRNGITQPIGLPQINIAGGALSFGGPSPNPSGRGDTTFIANDTLSCLCARHSLKFGGEFRQYLNNNYRQGTGAFNYPSVAAFISDTANSFSVTLGSQSSSIAQGAIGFFVQDYYNWRPNLTLDLGLRYDWNMTPEERYDRFIVFHPSSGALVRDREGNKPVYHQNNKNFQPRVGFAWDPFKDGKTSVRGAYSLFVDQPITNVVVGTSGNPPLATPLMFAGTILLESAIDTARAAGLAPVSIDHGFDNSYLQSWNFNLQRELLPNLAAKVGYFGSKGTHLILQRNINQPIDGVRPYPAVSLSSQILPGEPLGNITQTESTGNSNYNALWVSVSKRLSQGLALNAYYTWSKSLDYNSQSSEGIVVQDSYNLRGSRGLSEFDARQRFVASAIYDLPFHSSRVVRGWQLGIVMQAQSGNPVNIVTSDSTVTGVANTLRPDVTGPIPIIGSVDRWFDTSGFTPVSGFGNLGRNVVIGPGFDNIDFSVVKNTELRENIRVQFRVEVFNLVNHVNFGQPGNVVGTPGFGRITNTRFPTGESGSSRQLQIGMKLIL
jgi:hypothetical protein